jgi:hypothetical protein
MKAEADGPPEGAEGKERGRRAEGEPSANCQVCMAPSRARRGQGLRSMAVACVCRDRGTGRTESPPTPSP